VSCDVEIPDISSGAVSLSTPMIVTLVRRPVCGSRTSSGIGANVLSS
jgi:hypothetical protein